MHVGHGFQSVTRAVRAIVTATYVPTHPQQELLLVSPFHTLVRHGNQRILQSRVAGHVGSTQEKRQNILIVFAGPKNVHGIKLGRFGRLQWYLQFELTVRQGDKTQGRAAVVR